MRSRMRTMVWLGLAAMAVVYCLFPFVWTVLTALKPDSEIFHVPVIYWPQQLTVEHFVHVFARRPFGTYIRNSLVVASGGTLLVLALASLIAHRLRLLPYARAVHIQRWILVLAILPPTVLVIPLFMGIRALGLVNHPLGLILAYTLLNLPFAVWMLHAGFRRIPMELYHAATLDGFSGTGVLTRVVLPLSRPVLAVAGILVFIFCWNEFLIALTLMPEQGHYTVPVGIAMLSGSSIYEIPWGEINAAVTLTTVPVILAIALFQRWILEGLTAGAVKG